MRINLLKQVQANGAIAVNPPMEGEWAERMQLGLFTFVLLMGFAASVQGACNWLAGC